MGRDPQSNAAHGASAVSHLGPAAAGRLSRGVQARGAQSLDSERGKRRQGISDSWEEAIPVLVGQGK